MLAFYELLYHSVDEIDLAYFLHQATVLTAKLNTLRPKQNGQHIAGIFKCVLTKMFVIWFKFHWSFLYKVQ